MRLTPLILLLLASIGLSAEKTPVTRVLHTFDFEERKLGNPEDLPMYWRKSEGTNLPHYVNGRLTTDRVHSGQYSFRFDLNGGGLIYRYGGKRISVLTGAHYRVEGFCQTTVLGNARAQLTAYFIDLDGHTIPSSVTHSDLYAAKHADEPWKRLSAELSADDPNAAFLVIELGLLQPSQYAPQSLGDRTLFTQDINGSAWFDDITVSQVPQVLMSTDRPGNIFRRDDTLKLQVTVNDRFTDDLSAQLIIRNAEGKTVYQRSGGLDISSAETLGPGRQRLTLVLPDAPAGWYQASMVMASHGQYVGDQALDFVRLADNAPPTTPDARFGIIATRLPFEGWDELPTLLPYLSAGRVKLAVWSQEGDIQTQDSAAFDHLLERLQELGITPTACLTHLPPQLAKKLNGSQWTQIARAKLEDWQPQLAMLVARHANHLDRWQLGEDGSDEFVTQPAMRQAYKMVYKEFANLVQKPDLAMPWPAWYEMEGELPATIALSVPPSVLPSHLPLYMADLKVHEGHNLSLHLQPLDRRQYGREMQIRDMAQRVIYALAADARRIDLDLPFSVRMQGNAVVKQPEELLLTLRTLITALGGTTFKGKVPIAEGIEAFLFDKNGQGVLVLWDRGSESGMRQLAINLGPRATRLDLWGNASPLFQGTRAEDSKSSSPASASVQLEIGPMPIILLDIDGPMAQLRASVALDRPLLESSFMPHNRKIRFVNPYRSPVAGMLKLKAPTGWTINPPTFAFNLNPGETFERDITLEFPYNSFAGSKILHCEFQVQGESNNTFTVPLQLSLGLSDVGMQTLALRDGKDVIVQQMITNYGDKPIDYTAFAIYPGQARQERLVTNLGAGRTTIKKYRFSNVSIVPTTKVRAGVKELVGTRILNDEVAIQ